MELLQSLQEAMCTLNTPWGLDLYKHSHQLSGLHCFFNANPVAEKNCKLLLYFQPIILQTK